MKVGIDFDSQFIRKLKLSVKIIRTPQEFIFVNCEHKLEEIELSHQWNTSKLLKSF